MNLRFTLQQISQIQGQNEYIFRDFGSLFQNSITIELFTYSHVYNYITQLYNISQVRYPFPLRYSGSTTFQAQFRVLLFCFKYL